MLKRKFTSVLEQYLTENTNKILLVNGARQIGKSYLIRYVGGACYFLPCTYNARVVYAGQHYCK